MDILDIRDWKQTGEALKTEIGNAVKATQSIIIQPLPNKLVMTRTQYEDLEQDPEMRSFQGSVERIFITPHNAMDVIVK